jgi:hypothetical protein
MRVGHGVVSNQERPKHTVTPPLLPAAPLPTFIRTALHGSIPPDAEAVLPDPELPPTPPFGDRASVTETTTVRSAQRRAHAVAPGGRVNASQR